MHKNILVGFDGSPAAQRALDYALEMAGTLRSRVQVIYAVPLPTGSPEAVASLLADPEALHPGMAALIAERAARAGVQTDFGVVPGSAGDVLLAAIRQGGVDQLVIGSSGRGTLARWLLGSVMGTLVGNSQIPVTVVP
jgi:nucleotide-binding universal stress UspA family protein